MEYDLAGRIIGCAMKVHRTLGPGFLESVYQNALLLELHNVGLRAEALKAISVRYEGVIVGEFAADVLVNDEVIVENKAITRLLKVHEVQLVNYLTATGKNIGVLLNFGASSREYRKKFRSSQPPDITL